jgi:hypothetical protein
VTRAVRTAVPYAGAAPKGAEPVGQPARPAERPTVVLGRRVRRVVEAFAVVVCPPDLTSRGLLAPLIDEVEQFLAAFPPHVRRALVASFLTFDEGARLHPAGRGRRFVDLDDQAADRWFGAVAGGRSPALRNLVRLMRGVVAMSYYELPAVQADLGYVPDAYIAEVAARRLQVHGAAIERAERDVLVDGPLRRG